MGGGILVLGRGHISHSENALSSTLSLHSTLIVIKCKGIIMLPSYAIVDFYLFYDRAIDVQI